jgi:hypothetical protein
MKVKTIEKLCGKEFLSSVRLGMGAVNENDATIDRDIEYLTSRQLIIAYSAWHLKDQQWGKEFVDYYEILKKGEV